LPGLNVDIQSSTIGSSDINHDNDKYLKACIPEGLTIQVLKLSMTPLMRFMYLLIFLSKEGIIQWEKAKIIPTIITIAI